MKFRFDSKTHTYYYDGAKMTGVTTVLGVIAKPMLIQWAANMAVDYILKYANMEAVELTGNFIVTPPMAEQARTAHTRQRDARAVAGTSTHNLVECYVKSTIEWNVGVAQPHETDNHQLRQFVEWAVANEVTFLESEKVMYHPDWFVGGTCDLVFLLGGKKYVGDVKTSKAVYYEAHVQSSTYQEMLKAMGETDFHGTVVIHLPEDGKLQTYYNFDQETNLSVFLAALTIYRAKAMYGTMESNEKKERKQKKLTTN